MCAYSHTHSKSTMKIFMSICFAFETLSILNCLLLKYYYVSELFYSGRLLQVALLKF